jgi:hypothetical protein
MSIFYWLSEAQMALLRPYFQRAMVCPALMTGACSVGLSLSIAMGVFARIMTGLAAEAPDHKTISIDATYLKAHRTASGLRLKKGAWTSCRANKRRHEHETACRH